MQKTKAVCGILAVTAGLMMHPHICGGASWEGTDDFSGSLAKWDTTYIHPGQPSDGFFLSGGHLQFIKTVTTTIYEGNGILVWSNSLPFNTNWTLMVDTHLHPTPQLTDQDIILDLFIFRTNPVSAGAGYFRIAVGTSPLGNTIAVDGPNPTNILGTDVTLGMSYDSASKQITSFYFPTGSPSSLVTIGTTNVSAWSQMQPVLHGLSHYWAVGVGGVWFDNFGVHGEPSSAGVKYVKAIKPSFEFLKPGRTYQLQVSSNLNAWTNQGTPFVATNFNMAYPQYWDVDNWGKLFFRLQAAP